MTAEKTGAGSQDTLEKNAGLADAPPSLTGYFKGGRQKKGGKRETRDRKI